MEPETIDAYYQEYGYLLAQNHWDISDDWEFDWTDFHEESGFLCEPFWDEMDSKALSREHWTPTSLFLADERTFQVGPDFFKVVRTLTSLTALNIIAADTIELWKEMPPHWTHMRHLAICPNDEELAAFQNLIAQEMTNLESLVLYNSLEGPKPTLNLSKLTNLTALNILGCGDYDLTLDVMPCMRVMLLSYSTAEPASWLVHLPQFTTLERLEWRDMSSKTFSQIGSYLPVATSLTRLKLATPFKTYTPVGKDLYAFLPKLPSLTSVDILFEPERGDEWADWLAGSSLTQVPNNVWNFEEVDVLWRMTALRQLDLQGTYFRNKHKLFVLSKMTRLTSLKLWKLFDNLPTLKGLTQLQRLKHITVFDGNQLEALNLYFPALTDMNMTVYQLKNQNTLKQMTDFLQHHVNLTRLKLDIINCSCSIAPLWDTVNKLPHLTDLAVYLPETYTNPVLKQVANIPPGIRSLGWSSDLVIHHAHLALENCSNMGRDDATHSLDDGNDPSFMMEQNEKRNKRLVDILITDPDFSSWMYP